MRFIPLGDSGLTAILPEAESIGASALANELRRLQLPGVVDVLAAFDTVTLFYDAARISPSGGSIYDMLCQKILETRRGRVEKTPTDVEPPLEIPVVYGGEHGPDLVRLAISKGISEDQVIRLHSSAEYVVRAVGFMPGFGYLTGLPRTLQTPRLATPRTRVPAGSVGIGGEYTGVYPFESPGGWNLIGHTRMILVDPTSTNPSKLHVGQTIRFKPTPAEA